MNVPQTPAETACERRKVHLKEGKDPHPQDFGLTKKTARFTKGPISSLLPSNRKV